MHKGTLRRTRDAPGASAQRGLYYSCMTAVSRPGDRGPVPDGCRLDRLVSSQRDELLRRFCRAPESGSRTRHQFIAALRLGHILHPFGPSTARNACWISGGSSAPLHRRKQTLAICSVSAQPGVVGLHACDPLADLAPGVPVRVSYQARSRFFRRAARQAPSGVPRARVRVGCQLKLGDAPQDNPGCGLHRAITTGKSRRAESERARCGRGGPQSTSDTQSDHRVPCFRRIEGTRTTVQPSAGRSSRASLEALVDIATSTSVLPVNVAPC